MKGHKTLAMLAAMALAAPALAQEKPAAPALAGYTMPQTATWDMSADDGQIYRIFVSFPNGEPPEGGYPVLYVLDGNAMFAAFAETRRMVEWTDAGKAIVVGVGYPTDMAYDVRRIDDFTGAPTTSGAYAKFAKEKSGGWDRFLDFLTGKLRGEIGKRYKTNPDRQSLFGHSLGGLFALHALYTRPGAFHAIIAASPSIFWHEALTLKEERDFAARLAAGKVPRVSRLLVVAGDREEAILERWDAEDFVKRMAPLSAYGLRTRSEIFEGEGHMTVPVRAVPATLRFATNWP
ncbi:MAG TPA: alpha/beta hydrolase-fold protein [Sphingobium sp.]|nr:alpha/beta hydrolase-fold protein [Sphingobium sp.]